MFPEPCQSLDVHVESRGEIIFSMVLAVPGESCAAIGRGPRMVGVRASGGRRRPASDLPGSALGVRARRRVGGSRGEHRCCRRRLVEYLLPFFDYFPRKEDVLHEAGAVMAAAFDDAVQCGLADGERSVAQVLVRSFAAVGAAAPRSPEMRSALLCDIVNHPGRMTAFLADRGQATWMDAATRLLAEGQRRGEVRDDYPALALAAVLLQAWAMSANRDAARGRPPGDWSGPSRSLGALAIEICLAGMRP